MAPLKKRKVNPVSRPTVSHTKRKSTDTHAPLAGRVHVSTGREVPQRLQPLRVTKIAEQHLREKKAEYKAKLQMMSLAELELLAADGAKSEFKSLVLKRIKSLKARAAETKKQQLKELRKTLPNAPLTEFLEYLKSCDESTQQIAKSVLFDRLARLPLLELVRVPDRPGLEWTRKIVIAMLNTNERWVKRRLRQLSSEQLVELVAARFSPPVEWVRNELAKKKMEQNPKLKKERGGRTPTPFSSNNIVDWWREQS